jgi:hypothetical protein
MTADWYLLRATGVVSLLLLTLVLALGIATSNRFGRRDCRSGQRRRCTETRRSSPSSSSRCTS